MTLEEKELLLCDLSARLPYSLKCKCPILSYEIYTIVSIELNDVYPIVGLNTTRGSYIYAPLEEVKPYLRPMSSMTEEEKKEYHEAIVKSLDCSFENSESAITIVNDWLLSKHFDVRGLIHKELVFEAPKGMYEH